MDNSSNLNVTLHRSERLKKGAFFLRMGRPCLKIGQLISGAMRGFVHDQNGKEITTHFYLEGDMVIGTFIPNVLTTMAIQCLEDCEVSIADYTEVMSLVNVNQEITDIVNREFQKLTQQVQTRLVSLINLSALDKYELFLRDYPGLLNRIPHYLIAQYLGITPTQLSRVRKQFVNKCK